MFTTLEQQWPDFIKEIEQHDAERAKELAEVFKQGFDDVAVRIWPNLQRIVAFGAGKFQSQTAAMKRYAKSVTHNHGHLITIESIIAQALSRHNLRSDCDQQGRTLPLQDRNPHITG